MNKSIEASMEEAKEIIRDSSNIYIASHINPDGDNIGSMLALGLGLKKIGKSVKILKSDSLPEEFNFLPGYYYIEDLNSLPDEIALFIALDSSDEDRLGENKRLLEISKTIINIDHHISNNKFGHINIVDPNAAATGELVFNFLQVLGINIDKEIAENIYTAISTDTGSFKYESVTSNTHLIVSQLIQAGIKVGELNIKLYESQSLNKTRLFITALGSMNIYFDGKLALVKISQEMLEEVNAKMEDSEGIVSFLRKIEGVEVACLLKELKEEDIKISIRSKEYVDVSLLCEELGGGGHKRAAGCSIYSSLENAEKTIIEKLKKHLR